MSEDPLLVPTLSPISVMQQTLQNLGSYPFHEAEQRLEQLSAAVDAFVVREDLPELDLEEGRFSRITELRTPFSRRRNIKPTFAHRARLALRIFFRKFKKHIGKEIIIGVLSVIVFLLFTYDDSNQLQAKGYKVIWVTGVVLVLLVGRYSPDGVLMGASLVLTVGGIITPKEAWAAFSNEVVLSVAGLGVIAHAVGQTGVIDIVFSALLGRPKSVSVAMLRLFLPAVVLNVCVSNTCVMSCLIPVIETWSTEIGIHKAAFLMPLSYLLLISGVFAIFSTSTNLITQGLLIVHHEPVFDNFDLAIPVVACTLATVVYLILATPIVLRRYTVKEKSKQPLSKSRAERFYDLRVQICGRGLDAKALSDTPLFDIIGGSFENILGCERYGSQVSPIAQDFVLYIDDVLLLRTSTDGIVNIHQLPGVMLVPLDKSEVAGGASTQSRELVEAAIDAACPLVGHRLLNSHVYMTYGGSIVAYRRFNVEPKALSHQQRSEAANLQQMRLRHGDQVIFDVSKEFYPTWKDSSDFVVLRRLTEVQDFSGYQEDQRAYAWIAGGILLCMVVLVASSTLHLLEAVFCALAALIVTKCTTLDSAIRAVKLRTVLTIVGAFGLGKAVSKTGVAEQLANIIIALLKPFGNTGLLVAVFVATVALGVVFHGTAVVVLMYPVCRSAAASMSMPIHQIMAVLMIAVSCQMLSPISYQTNLMAYTSGGYEFSDFFKLGAGLVVVIALVSIPVCMSQFEE